MFSLQAFYVKVMKLSYRMPACGIHPIELICTGWQCIKSFFPSPPPPTFVFSNRTVPSVFVLEAARERRVPLGSFGYLGFQSSGCSPTREINTFIFITTLGRELMHQNTGPIWKSTVPLGDRHTKELLMPLYVMVLLLQTPLSVVSSLLRNTSF